MAFISIEELRLLSYKTTLSKSLKNSLHRFDKSLIIEDIERATDFYANNLEALAHYQYRIKAMDSVLVKYTRYYPNYAVERTFNDILGFRFFCDSYDEADTLYASSDFFHRRSDMRMGKTTDDGYRGVHIYFQLDHYHYPIEIQFNTRYDRRMNDWLHRYLYKSPEKAAIGLALRKLYETGDIQTESQFIKALRHKKGASICHT